MGFTQDQPSLFLPEDIKPEFEIVLTPREEYDRKLMIAISDVLIEFMQKTGKSLTDISKGTKVSISTLADWINGKPTESGSREFQSSIRLDWRIFAVMRFVGCSLETLVMGIGEIPDERSELLKQFEVLEVIDFAKYLAAKQLKFMTEPEIKKAQKLGLIKAA